MLLYSFLHLDGAVVHGLNHDVDTVDGLGALNALEVEVAYALHALSGGVDVFDSRLRFRGVKLDGPCLGLFAHCYGESDLLGACVEDVDLSGVVTGECENGVGERPGSSVGETYVHDVGNVVVGVVSAFEHDSGGVSFGRVGVDTLESRQSVLVAIFPSVGILERAQTACACGGSLFGRVGCEVLNRDSCAVSVGSAEVGNVRSVDGYLSSVVGPTEAARGILTGNQNLGSGFCA